LLAAIFVLKNNRWWESVEMTRKVMMTTLVQLRAWLLGVVMALLCGIHVIVRGC